MSDLSLKETLQHLAHKVGVEEGKLIQDFQNKYEIKVDTKKKLDSDTKQKLVDYIKLYLPKGGAKSLDTNQTVGRKKQIPIEYIPTKKKLGETVKPQPTPVSSGVQVKAPVQAEAEAVRSAEEEKPKPPPAVTEVKDQKTDLKKASVQERPNKIAKPFAQPDKKGVVSKVRKKRRFDSTRSNFNNTDKHRKSIFKYDDNATQDADGNKDALAQQEKGGGKLQVKIKHGFQRPVEKKSLTIEIGNRVLASDIANKMGVKVGKVLRELQNLGEHHSGDSELEHDVAFLVIGQLGHKAVHRKKQSPEDLLLGKKKPPQEAVSRPPVVTIMGHVDHGKTTLLDRIRNSSVADKEAGGITQHLAAYHVDTPQGRVTFVDTPGHAAFTAMRSRGVMYTDIVVLIVAADDGVQPQTVEIIDHVKRSEVPMVVVINKIDRATEQQIESVKQQLSQHDVLPEEWGGKTPVLKLSAKGGQGIEEFLEFLALQAEVMELKSANKGDARGVILECRMEVGKGSVVTLLVQSGELKQGDIIVSGSEFAKIRNITDSAGNRLKKVTPSIPVKVTGFSGLPQTGDIFLSAPTEKMARDVCDHRTHEHRVSQQKSVEKNLEDLFVDQGEDIRQLGLIIKADTNGSVEALAESIRALVSDKIAVNIVSQGVGGIKEADVALAMDRQALIIAFNVRADGAAQGMIKKESIEVYYHSIIYEAVDQIRQILIGRLDPVYKEEIVGIAEVRDVFQVSKIGSVAGCMVLEGAVKRNNPIRVLRDNVVIYQGELESLRRFKEDVASVKSNTECGIGVKNYKDVRAGDLIEVFERTEIKPDSL